MNQENEKSYMSGVYKFLGFSAFVFAGASFLDLVIANNTYSFVQSIFLLMIVVLLFAINTQISYVSKRSLEGTN